MSECMHQSASRLASRIITHSSPDHAALMNLPDACFSLSAAYKEESKSENCDQWIDKQEEWK